MSDEKELKDQRVPIMMTPSELEAIDDWMFKNRIRSRGEAIRRLCRIGLVSSSGLNEIFDLHLALAKVRLGIEDRRTDLDEERALNRLSLTIAEISLQVEALEKGAANFDDAVKIAEANRDKMRRALAASDAVFDMPSSDFGHDLDDDK